MLKEYTITYWLDKDNNGIWDFVVMKHYGTVLVNIEINKDPSYIKTRFVNNEIEIYGDGDFRIDDVRIYATALSEEDIIELYMTRASLDDYGNLYMSQLNNLPEIIDTSITEKGIAKAPIISELGIIDGLVGYWPLDGNAKDYSGNMNHGVVNGATVASGIKGECYNFDGVDDSIICGKLKVDSIFSFSFWMNEAEDINTSKHIVSNANKGGFVFSTYVNYPYFYYQDKDGISSTAYKYTKLGVNKWRYITGVSDGKTTYLYVDGELWHSKEIPSDFVFNSVETNLVFSKNSWKGSLNEVRIYNRALTEEEVKIQYDLYKPGGSKMKITNNGIYISGEFKEGF